MTLHATRIVGCALAAGLLFAPALAQSPAQTEQLTVVGAGGVLQDAERAVFFRPFADSNKVQLTEDSYSGQMAKVRAMVDTGSVSWDVLQVEQNSLLSGCEEGLFEKIDWTAIGDRKDFIDEAYSECGVGAFVWSMVMTYDRSRIADGPKSWADFWNVQRWPGKRGLRQTAKMTLEIALLADGVPRGEVYKVLATPAGVDRAFASLDRLKPDILWWTSGAEPIERLASGDVVISAAFNGRVAAANQGGRSFALAWDGQVLGVDYWAIPKGAKNRATAERFIAFASRPEVQARFPSHIAYGVTNRKANLAVDPKLAADLPTSPANFALAVPLDTAFWADHGEALEARFANWRSR
ncbi:putative spermidine/putrescine transport system substrate-binding protein [Azospirillum brasilense]|nr:putative spermidine/putrescine transport system substrate-binding protein [Azospirillum brasilense]